MVSSIVPGAAGASALGVDPRYARAQNGLTPQAANEGGQQGDSVQIGDAAQWSAARDSVRKGLAQLGEALAAGRDVYALLNKVSTLAQTPDSSQADLNDTLDALQRRVEDAVAQGASVVSGADLTVQAEPGAPGVTVHGVDLRLKSSPGYGDAIAVPRNATLDNPPALAAAAQKSMDQVQSGMDRLIDAARALDAHQGFLGAAADAVSGVSRDLDADSARLMALQVRQGLDASGGAAIANVEPQAVLSLFRT